MKEQCGSKDAEKTAGWATPVKEALVKERCHNMVRVTLRKRLKSVLGSNKVLHGQEYLSS